jgi:hypothetical protein
MFIYHGAEHDLKGLPMNFTKGYHGAIIIMDRKDSFQLPGGSDRHGESGTMRVGVFSWF